MKSNFSTSAAERTNRVINDFGAKIGGARKDLYQAARDWADRLADITAGDLAKAGLSKLVKLHNLEKLAEVGAISEEAARAALVIWRSIDRKPTYGVTRWAEATREKLDAIAAALVNGNVNEDTSNAAEFKVLTAANWPVQPFTFGKYSVCFSRYNGPRYLRIYSGRFYCGDMSDDAASIAAQVRTMTAADEAKAAERRAAGPALSVYKNRAGQYFITPEGRPEIVLHTYETSAEAFAARNNDRAALIARYNALKTFPDCRRDWNRPRVGEDWRKGENMTPEAFAAALPFRGVEFGNWVNQTERAALLNSAFDGFHDLAAVLGITPAAVCLNGSLAFAFASRGHSKAAAHYETARRVINLTKKNGAGCMAHEWFHAVDNMAAGGGVNSFATEGRGTAGAILDAIKKTDFYKRSAKMAGIKGSAYWIEGRELAARAFEGVCAVLLNAAGICSDFLVNCLTMDEFTALDVERRADYYPYPTADEAAALLPYYVAFLNEFFGGVTVPAAALADSERAARKAEADRIAAEKLAEERRAARRAQIEAEKKAAAEKAAAEEKAREERAAATVASVRDMMEARHFDSIATAFDASTVYAIGHHQGEIYTLSADIATAEEQGENYINSLSAACVHYKRVHNAKRIIFAYGRPEVRASKYNAAEFVQMLTPEQVRHIVASMQEYETADAFEHAEKVYQDTQRAHAEQQREKATANAAEADQTAPAEGLQLVEIPGGVAVVSDDWRATYANRRAIKAHGARWNKDAKQWQATDAEAVAMLRNWFGVAHNEQPAEPEHVETLAEAEPNAPALPGWLKVGAKVRTRGRYMMTTRSSRPAWVEGEEMEITAITADWVSLKSDTARESISTATAAEELTPIYNPEQEKEPTAHDFVEALKAIVNDNIGHHVFTIGGHEIEVYTPNDKHPLWIVAPSIFEHMQMTFDEVAEYLQQESRKKEPEQPTAPDFVAFQQTEVTNPIKAEDLDTPRVFNLSERRDIVTGCTPEQAGELEHMGGKPSAAGVVFRTSKENRYRLHVWQNEQSRKQRAEILGEGWQYVSGDSTTHAKPGDVVACVDGTRGICTQSSPESCVIEFQTKKGQRLSVAGYFLKQA